MDEDGGSITPDVAANFEIPPKGGALHLVMEVQTIFPRLGRYEFLISVDKHQLDSWSLDAKEFKPPEKK